MAQQDSEWQFQQVILRYMWPERIHTILCRATELDWKIQVANYTYIITCGASQIIQRVAFMPLSWDDLRNVEAVEKLIDDEMSAK